MWIEVEESELTDNLRKFLQFRCREARETEWLKNEFGTTWGCSDVYNIPGIKYEIISFLTNEDSYVLRYWKEDNKQAYTGTGSDYLDCVLGVGGFEKYGPIEK